MRAWVMSLTGLLLLSGCGGPVEGVRTEYTVSGKVLFNGQPVTEGRVSFEDAAAGLGGASDLDANGGYSTPLAEGNYKVVVQPPEIQLPDTENSPGGTEFKPVANIPEKYRAADTSPLTAEVHADKTEHNFELTP